MITYLFATFNNLSNTGPFILLQELIEQADCFQQFQTDDLPHFNFRMI